MVATALMILGLAAIALPFRQAAAAQPTLAVAPTSAVIGARVAVSGSGFAAKSTIQLAFDGSAGGMPKVKASSGGAIKVSFVVPNVSPGTHAVQALSASQSGGNRATSGGPLAATTLAVEGVASTPAPTGTPTAAPVAPTPVPTPVPTPLPAPATASPSPVATSGPIGGYVTRSGTHLVADGTTYRFRGLNLYNINGDGDCGYAIPSLDNELDQIGGSANVVRGWFFQYLATNHATRARDWSKFDATLATLRAHGIRVIATLADEWGACEAAASRGPLQIGWYSRGYRATPYSADVSASYRDWVAQVVTRYRNDPTILAWQLMNEATAVSDASGSCPDQDAAAAALQAWAADMAGLVKSLDPNHLLSIGTSGSSQCGTTGSRYQALYATAGVDLCESHDYTAPKLALSDGITWEIDSCANLNKPIFVGEVGITGSSVSGDLSLRAALFKDKFAAQLGAGMVGELVWAWRSAGDGGSSRTSFDVGPGDPTLPVLAALPTR